MAEEVGEQMGARLRTGFDERDEQEREREELEEKRQLDWRERGPYNQLVPLKTEKGGGSLLAAQQEGDKGQERR